MSGAQGAQPPGSRTATVYTMVPGASTENTREGVESTQDSGGVAIVSQGDHVKNSAGLGGPIFGTPEATEAAEKPEETVAKSPDLGVSG